LVYPPDMLASRREGWANIQCDVGATGRPRACQLLNSSAPAFGRAALTFIAHGIYDTATDDEPSVIYLRHRFHVEFLPPND
jgi:TonB family protein